VEEEIVGIRTIRSRLHTCSVVTLILLSMVIIMSPSARADTWTETNHADFNDGTSFVGTEVVGVGADASVQIVRTHDDWINMTPEHLPPSRNEYGLAYDKTSEVMVLFGGNVIGEGLSNETWEYDYAGNNWTRVQTNGTPSARSSAGMAYDLSDDVIVLFGGYGDGGFLQDTWEYYVDNHTWVEVVTDPHPKEMNSSPMVYDTLTSRIMLVGEEVASSDFQTWKYNPLSKQWTNLDPVAEPPSRAGHALAFDKKIGRVVLFGGAAGMSFLGDTWEYDPFGNEWLEQTVTGPSPRVGASMEYLPFWEGVILFGGMSSGEYDNQTWLYTSFGAPKWESVFTTEWPEGRSYANMEYDYRSDMILLFSGGNTTSWFNETWLYGPNYIPEGRYASSVFDSSYGETDWSQIWWNQTMTSRPKHTKILLQLAASNFSYGPFSLGGPDGASDTYYELGEGESVWEGMHGRFLKYMAVLQTFRGIETPALEDIAITFDLVPADPKILRTVPVHTDPSYPVDGQITVYFSERIDTSSVQFTIQPDIELTVNWSLSDTVMTLSHATDFTESTTYTVEITAAKDMDGNDLVQGPVPNPWTFTTVNLFPYIIDASPYFVEDVPLSTSVEIMFSEPMNTSTLLWNITPDPGGWFETWAPNDTHVALSHSNPFGSCTFYEFEVRYAEDLSGNQLVPGPPPNAVANPWNFKSYCDAPYITYTLPGPYQPSVSIGHAIFIGFSEPMDPSSLIWTIDPDPGGWSVVWNNTAEVGLHHANDFVECMSYTVEVTQAKDLSGKDLEPNEVPNPWTFTTVCDSPYMMHTVPEDGATDVPVNGSIYLAFSEELDIPSFTWEITPDIGAWDEEWMLAILKLTPFGVLDECTNHTLNVTYAQDKSGNPLVPGPVPNPFTFKTSCIHPIILWTDPADQARDVPLDTPILVKWNEPMNASAFSLQIAPDIDLVAKWNPAEDLVTLTHSEDFIGSTTYTVYADGYDKDGHQWRPSPTPNPWKFTTVPADNPYIISKDPETGEGNVPFFKNITVVFSKAMNKSTVTWSISQGMTLAGSWSNGSTRLVLTHAEPFIECANYDIEVDGYDWQGLRLAPPKVWFFSAVCYRPYIVSTSPEDGAVQVPPNETIVVEFSETINETTLVWDIDPNPGGWVIEWNWNSSIAYFNHSVNFTDCLEYDVEMVTFKDMDDRLPKAGLVPNPWGFMSQCGNPYIVSTDPYNLQEEVPFDYPLTVVFSEPMATDTVSWSLDPNYWPPNTIVFSVQWFENDTRAVFSHLKDFHVCETYSFWITSGSDNESNHLVPGPVPNPFNFTTVCPNPYIIFEEPSNGEMDATLTVPIEIRFSETMNKNSFAWTITPDPGGWSQYWNMSDTRVLLSHSNLFEHCTQYVVKVTYIEDIDGNPLIAGPYPFNETHPNPWTFQTYCDAPFIVSTSPSDMEENVSMNVSVLITFSEAIDPTTLLFTVIPTSGGWVTDWLTPSEVYLNRSYDLPPCSSETVHVTQATDLEGKQLIPGPVPNPWTFKVVCPNPRIMSTDPADGEGGVPLDAPVVVAFDRPMDPSTLDWTINPDPGGWTVVWDGSYTTLTLTHSNLFAIDTVYEAEVVSILDDQGNPLMSGPVPNPWQFTTGETVSPPAGLQVMRTFPDDVWVVWDPVGGATSYHVYSTTDRFEQWPWTSMTDIAAPITLAVFPGHLSDGLDHYYLVRAYNDVLGKESGNSTMGTKLNRDFVASPSVSSIYWMSIPYRSIYARASDIASELSESKVNIVAKWDRDTQEMISYYFARGKWRGRDFTLNPGDGFYVSAVSDFAWFISGTDFAADLDFGFMPAPTKTNAHWISLAPTSVYARASDIVNDIEGGLGPGTNTNIIEVRKWDPSTSTEIVFYYGGNGWTGVDFDVSGAEGICLQVVSSFSWSPKLITPAVD
jgi:hypothetical protein